MTREDTERLLKIMSALYPTWKPADWNLTVDAWYAVLAEENAQKIANALKRYARRNTSGFAPPPGELIRIAEPSKWAWGEDDEPPDATGKYGRIFENTSPAKLLGLVGEDEDKC